MKPQTLRMKELVGLVGCGSSLVFVLVLSSGVGLVSASDEESMPSLPPNIRAAVAVLDDADWFSTETSINADLASGTPEAEARARSQIQMRELTAIQQFIAAGVPQDQRDRALARWIDHRNEGVAAIAAGELLSHGAWDAAPSIERSMRGWSRAAQLQLMQTLANADTRRELMSLARVLADEALASPGRCESDEAELYSFVAAKFLVRSPEERDRSLLVRLLDRCPGNPYLWLAVSRIETPDSVIRLAEQILEDDQKPEGLRAAAGLVSARRHPAAYRLVWSWIQEYLDKFATADGVKVFATAARQPLDPDARSIIRDYKEGQIFVGVLRELPRKELLSRLDFLVSRQSGMPGICAATILARRVPTEFVSAIEGSDIEPDNSIHAALFLAALEEPEIGDRVKALLPNGEFDRLERQRVTLGDTSLAGACAHLTLWD